MATITNYPLRSRKRNIYKNLKKRVQKRTEEHQQDINDLFRLQHVNHITNKSAVIISGIDWSKKEKIIKEGTIEDEVFNLLKHKITKITHLEDIHNDDYLCCGHLMWPSGYDNFYKLTGTEEDITCKKCLDRLYSKGGIGLIPWSRIRF